MKTSLSWMIFLLICCTGPAKAAVLFLNLNDSPSEVEAARRAAKARGEEFLLLPSEQLSLSARKKMTSLDARVEHIRGRLATNLSEGSRVKFLAELREISRDREQLVPPSARFNLADLSRVLARAADTPIRTVVVSGHSSGLDFSGRLGSFALQDLPPAALTGLRSAYLPGCYSGTPAAMRWWKEQFPEISFVAGYSKKGFLSGATKDGRPVSASILYELMVREGGVLQEQELDKIVGLLRQVQDRLGDPAKPLSFLVNCEYMIPKERKNIALDRMDQELCQGAGEFLSSMYITSYLPYESGEKPIPSDGQSTPLRQYYNAFQSLQHCKSPDLTAFPRPNVSQVISLIKYPYVLENFRRYYSDDISLLRPILRRLEDRGLCRGSVDFLSTDRKKLVAFDGVLTECLAALDASKAANSFAPFERRILEKMRMRVSRVLIERECVPAILGNWIEDSAKGLTLGSPAEVPSCEELD